MNILMIRVGSILSLFRYKVWINVLLVRLGIREILPGYIVGRKRIKENGDPLVNLLEYGELSYAEECHRQGGCWVRKTVAEKLLQVAASLSEGYSLHLYEGWRSQEAQQKYWEAGLLKAREKYPEKSEEEISRLVRLAIASPSSRIPPHQTGGAVDLSLTLNGQPVDMGTSYLEFTDLTKSNALGLAGAVRINRNLLLSAMKQAGFQNYPAEWWHYSFGDQAWAAYQRKRFALYGQIQPPMASNKV